MRYESHKTPPLTQRQFLRRMALHIAVSQLLAVLSLLVGIAGYMHYENLAWRDAFLNAAMLLGGMGPVNPPVTDGGKLFAGFYALYAGLVFLIVVGIMLAPILHRLLHQFHWEEDDEQRGGQQP
jgi:hypothetical protein